MFTNKTIDTTKYTNYLSVILIVLGCFFRINHYLEFRSLWWDESYMALSIIGPTWLEVFEHKSFLAGQPMLPLGFLLIQKSLISIFGIGELILRLLSQISALASIFIFFKIIKKILPPTATLIALSFFCLSDSLIYFSAELKTYSFDLLLCLLLYWFVISVDFTRMRNWFILFLFGFIGLWSSFAFVFVLCAVSLVLWIKFLIQKQFRSFFILSAIGVFWIAGLYFEYLLAFKPMLANSSLVSMWTQGFLPSDLTTIEKFRWLFLTLQEAFGNPGNFSVTGLVLIFYFFGMCCFWRSHKEFASMLISTNALALFAGVLGKYPFYGRVILFVFPSMVIFVSLGVAEFFKMFGRFKFQSVIAIALVFVFYGQNYSNVLQKSVEGYSNIENRKVMNYLFQNWQPGDQIFINNASQYSYLYYLQYFQMENKLFSMSLDTVDYKNQLGHYTVVLSDRLFEDDSIAVALPQIARSENGRILNKGLKSKTPTILTINDSNKLNSLVDGQNAWVLLTHINSKAKQFILSLFNQQGTLVQKEEFKDASIYLFRLRSYSK